MVKCMPILNYTTGISVEKTVSEIQQLLHQLKVTGVFSEYKDGILESLSFRLNTEQGELDYKLAANVFGIHKTLVNAKVKKTLKTKEQAARVGWRILKDWLKAQLAIIEAQMMTTSQVFLPYAITASGKTIYDCFVDSSFPGLPDKE